MRQRQQQRGRWRIAVVAPCAFPSARGSQVLIREVAEGLAQRGHTVHVVTYPWGENLVPIRDIHVHRAAGSWLVQQPWLPWLLRKLLCDVALIRCLLAVVREQGIDVMHAHNYEGPLVAFLVRWLTGVPIVYHAHNAFADELPWYVRWRWQRSVARMLGRVCDWQIPRRADHAIALTAELEAFLQQHGVDSRAISVIPPLPPPAVVDDGQVVSGWEALAGRFVVLYAGNVDAYQDLDVLARAMAVVRQQAEDATLVLVTHDPAWRKHIDRPLGEAILAGHAQVMVVPSFVAVRRLLARAQVLVCPRSSWSGFPIKLLNYLSAGRPIIAAEGSAKNLIDGSTALVVPNRDEQALAAAILRLRGEPDLAVLLAHAARTQALQAPSWDDVVRNLEQIYARVCGTIGAKGSRNPIRLEGVQELIANSRDRISAAPEDRAGVSVRTSYKLVKIAVALLLSVNLAACARQGGPAASLPPLDAPLPSQPGQSGPYRIQPGDLLRVKFMYHPELDVKVPVRPDGGVTLQVGGNIHAAGLTTEELEKVVVERTSDRLREPEVNVMVAQFADMKVYVMGEVRLPGIVPYRDGMTPLQAIADRGGFNDTARVDSVLRLSPSEDEYQGTRLDFSEPLEAGSPEGVQLHAGDVLYVPRTFIGDVNSFVRLYIRGLLPIEPRIGAGTSF